MVPATFLIGILATSYFSLAIILNPPDPTNELIPLFMGCFETWRIQDEVGNLTNNTGYVDIFDFVSEESKSTPASCILRCTNLMSSSPVKYDVALIKGSLCGCTVWNRTNFNLHPIRKVSDFHCDIPCPIIPNELPIDDLKFNCGGSGPYSAYCIRNRERSDIGMKPCEKPQFEIEDAHIYRNDLEITDGPISFEPTSCANCENCSFPSHGSPGFDYSPKNSPLRCINYCRRYLTLLQPDKALPGNENFWATHQAVVNSNNGFPSCFCFNLSTPMSMDFKMVEILNCNMACPGDNETICGGRESNRTDYHSFYDLVLPEIPVKNPTTDFSIDTTTGSDVSSKSESESASSSTVTNIYSTTIVPIFERSTFQTLLSTSIKTTTSIPDSTEGPKSTTTKGRNDSVPIPASSGTDKPNTTTRKAEPTTSPALVECEKICKKTDQEGTEWHECAGYASHTCTGNATGLMWWYCQPNGEFNTSQPNYKNCRTGWIENIREMMNETDELGYTAAYRLFKIIEKQLKLGRNMSDPNSKYYGHEISEIMGITHQILNMTTEISLEACENLTDIFMIIYDNVFINYNAWYQLPRMECTKLGTDFITLLEDNLLALSILVLEHYGVGTPGDYLRKYEHFTVKTIVGVKLEYVENSERFIFPPSANLQTDSFMELPDAWLSFFYNNYSRIEFVGIQIRPENSNYLFPADSSVYGSNNNSYGYDSSENGISQSENRIVNGKIMSFTFGINSKQAYVNSSGPGVKITFQHNVTAWGSEVRQIRRRLHDGECRKAVQGSATCAFWDPKLMSWSTDGCHLVQTERDKSICECQHLTAFALLMDLHQYAGRDIGLQILTWILCPLSVICLLLTIIVLTTLSSIKGSPRSIITRHLSICLVIVMVLMLTLMDRQYILIGDVTCILTGIAAHYFLLSAFIWMNFEGILLYRMVVLVFENGRDYMKHQLIVAYGIPLLIVAVTVFSSEFGNTKHAYGGDEFCWLQGDFIWAFLGPVSVILIINLAILFISLRTAYSLAYNRPSSLGLGNAKKSNFITLIHGSFSVAILLGVTWIFGYLMLVNNYTVANIAAYIFTILNASQGIFLFCFHCVWNAKVREALGSKFPYLIHSNSSSTFNSKVVTNSASSETEADKVRGKSL